MIHLMKKASADQFRYPYTDFLFYLNFTQILEVPDRKNGCMR